MDKPTPRQVLIEGYSVEEILAIPNAELDQFVFCGEPIVFRAGSAQILGKFERASDRIVVELAHIDGGGEGSLPAIGALASKYAQRKRLEFLEWRVHAVHCANPNLKLRRVLERRGFEVKVVQGVKCYHFIERCVVSNNSLKSDVAKPRALG
jgi:hypothetical protein